MLRSTPEVKRHNRERIRKELQEHDTFTKAEVASWTALSVSTCNTILNEMQADGEIIHLSHDESHVGRPASRFRYNPDHLHVLALYVVGDQSGNTVAFAVAELGPDEAVKVVWVRDRIQDSGHRQARKLRQEAASPLTDRLPQFSRVIGKEHEG